MDRPLRLCRLALATGAVPERTGAIRLLLALLNNGRSLHACLLEAMGNDGFWLGIQTLIDFRQRHRRHNPARSRHQPGPLRHQHLLPTTLPTSTTRVHLDARATHGHATGVDLYEAATGFEGDFGTRFNHGFLARFDVQFRAGLAKPGRAGFEVQGAGDVEAVVFASLFALFAVHGVVAVAFGVAEAVVVYRQVAVILNDFGAVVFRQQVQVFLGVDVDLRFIGFVFKTQLVAAFTLVGFGFQGGSCFVLRQRIERYVGRVVGSSGNNGLVRVAVQEGDDDFVADSRQGHEAVLAASPALADSEPGAAVLVVLRVTVPGEPDFHAAVLVAVDLFAFRAGDDGHLRAIHGRLVVTHWAPGFVGRDGGELVVVAGGFTATLFLQGRGLFAGVGDGGE